MTQVSCFDQGSPNSALPLRLLTLLAGFVIAAMLAIALPRMASAAPGETAWPGGSLVTTADSAGQFGADVSGLAYEVSNDGLPSILWAVDDGSGKLQRLERSGQNWVPASGWSNGRELTYPNGSGQPDAEGVTVAADQPASVFVVAERNTADSSTSRNSVLRYSTSGSGAIVAAQEWNLTGELVTSANSGLEAITWIPDTLLVDGGFIGVDGDPYDPADYPGHGAGLFFVAVEAGGDIFAYVLQGNGAFQQIQSMDSGLDQVMALEFDAETKSLWAACDGACDGQHARLELTNSGQFEPVAVHARPTGLPNAANEGLAIAPSSDCQGSDRSVIWADDANTSQHALRSGTLPCDAEFVEDPPSGTTSRFIITGDYGQPGPNSVSVVNLNLGLDPDFIIAPGDGRYGNSEFDNVAGLYCDYHADVEPGPNCPTGGNSSVNRFFPAAGNHEYNDAGGINDYLDYFTLPGAGVVSETTTGTELYYDAVVGMVHLFVIDSQMAVLNPTSRQVQGEWLQQALANSTAPWKVVVSHHPPYSSSTSHGSEAAVQYPFAAWGADIVATGHDHIYERSIVDGVTYIISGLSGRGTPYGIGTPIAGSQFAYNGQWGTPVFDVTPTEITGSFRTIDGQVLDNFTITQSAPADTTPPSIPVVSLPTVDMTLPFGDPLKLIGTATDETALAAVDFVLQDVNAPVASSFLQDDGVTFGPFNRIDTTLADPGAPSTTFDHTVVGLEPGEYLVYVGAADTAGNLSPFTGPRSVTIGPESSDVTAPSIPDVIEPANELVVPVGTAINLAGDASDNVAVASVEFALIRQGFPSNVAALQDDRVSWGPENSIETFLGTPGSPTTTWSDEITGLDAGQYLLLVRAFDAAGNGSSFTEQVSITVFEESIVDVTPPSNPVITSPEYLAEFDTEGAVTITGSVTDETSISGIKAYVIRMNQPFATRFLQDDLVTFGPLNFFTPEVDSPGAPTTSFSFDIGPLPEGTFIVGVYGIDGAGNQSPSWGRVDIQVVGAEVVADVTAPSDAIVTSPVNGAELDPGVVTVTGTATDETSIGGLEVTVLKLGEPLSTRFLQDDLVSFGPANTFDPGVASPGSASTPFSFDIGPLPSGDYSIKVIAVDEAGNISEGAPVVEIEVNGFEIVDTVSPSTAVVITPVDEQVFETPTVITVEGTVTDETSLAELDVLVLKVDEQPYRYLQDDMASFGDYKILNLPVDNPGAATSSYSFDFTPVAAGHYIIAVYGRDEAGNRSNGWQRVDIHVE